MKYNNLSDDKKKDLIKLYYENHKKSFSDIAKEFDTYANKIRRDAIRFKINIRDKSEAQKNALTSGKIKHPTKGKVRSLDTKNKIGMSVLQSWENLNQDQIQARKNKAKINWENKSEDEKADILKQANAAVRLASKVGSKLEKYLLNLLIKDGFNVEFHKEQSILNTKLQIDLFIPKLNVAIEIDGPSHFEPVWGDDSLKRNQKYDNKKTGLIIGKGLFLIRIKQTKDFSKSRGLLIFQELQKILQDIGSNNITHNKVLTIGD
jgi:very-short-patch-repair endonuclease